MPVLLNSCSAGNPATSGGATVLPESGLIHKKILCQNNPGKSYALYLPVLQKVKAVSADEQARVGSDSITSGLNTTGQQYPLIIAFDPHGDGALPLSLYKSLADKYGFILIGSNDSKNGLPGEEVRAIIASLMKEARTISTVDTSRVYLLGFSGGARVASMAAMYQVQAKGIICCGAGLAGSEQPALYKFDYFGLAGSADFNMNELLQLEEPLTRAGLRHFIRIFPGIHAWPPEKEMEDAFVWIVLNDIKDGSKTSDPVFMREIERMFDSRLAEAKKNRHYAEAADDCREAISFLDGLSGVDKYRNELSLIEATQEYKSQVANRIKVLKEEENEKQGFMQELQTENIAWWKDKIKKYNSGLKSDGSGGGAQNPEDTLKNKRLLAFLSLFCYMNANSAIAQQNELASIKIVSVYELADPQNPEPNYMRAILLARRSDDPAAVDQLKIAVAKGFADKQRLMGQAEFISMNSTTAWFDLLKTMK